MILEKMRSCLFKLGPGFWTYAWICLLGSGDPNVVSRPRPQGQQMFLVFMNLLDLSQRSWENEVLFVKTGARVLDFWLQVFQAHMAQILFLDPMPKVNKSFEISGFHLIHLIIPEKMKSCFWKLKLGFSRNGLMNPLQKALGPNCPKLVQRPQTSNVRALGSEIFFMSSSIKFCLK